jgi:RNA polymerase sigma factor (TIGR02999 family)
MADTDPGEVTRLLQELQDGDSAAVERLTPLVYDELKRLARSYMRRERPDHTLQATALVNEAYLKLVRGQNSTFESRTHFFSVAAQVMRHVLVDYARSHRSEKRGGAAQRLELSDALAFSESQCDELLALDEALTRLAALSPRQVKVVELRFFSGLSVQEAASVMGVAPRTVDREWSVAQAWLKRELNV